MKTINLLPKSVSRELQLDLIASQVTNFWIWFLLSLGIFFALVLGSIFYIKTETQKIDDKIFEQKETLLSSNTKELQARVSALNRKLKTIGQIHDGHYYWSQGLVEIANLLPVGMRVDVMTLEKETGKVEVTGVTDDRENALEFWANIKKSKNFSNINFPLSNLEKAQNGDFTFVFFVKPEFLQNETTD